MATRLTVDETRTSLDHAVKQIKDTEDFIGSIYRNGSGPLIIDGVCKFAILDLRKVRGELEKLICWFDS